MEFFSQGKIYNFMKYGRAFVMTTLFLASLMELLYERMTLLGVASTRGAFLGICTISMEAPKSEIAVAREIKNIFCMVCSCNFDL